MNEYKCAYCKCQLDLSLAQITVTRHDDNMFELIGNVCLSCEGKIKKITVWKCGNKELGWSITDKYSVAYETLINDEMESELEIIKTEMLDVDYNNLPEFEGF